MLFGAVVGFMFTIIPITCCGACCGNMEAIGQGFKTYEFDEVKEMAIRKDTLAVLDKK
jgi:hypothetical protein